LFYTPPLTAPTPSEREDAATPKEQGV